MDIQTLRSVGSNSGSGKSKPKSDTKKDINPNISMTLPVPKHQSIGGSIASAWPFIQPGQQISGNPIALQAAAKNDPAQSMQKISQNPIGTVINQASQQVPNPIFAPMNMVPLQAKFSSFPQMYLQRTYPTQYPHILPSQQYLWNQDALPAQYSNGYFPSHGLPKPQTIPPQMSTQPIPTEPQQQGTWKGKISIPIIDPKTGKNILSVDKNPGTNSEKEPEHSNASITVQFTIHVGAVLNDTCRESKQQETVGIDNISFHNNEEKMQDTPVDKVVGKNITKELILPSNSEVLNSSSNINIKIPEKLLSEGKKKKKDLCKPDKCKDVRKKDSKEDSATSPVSFPLTVTSVDPISVPTLLSERNQSPLPIKDSEISNSIPFPGGNPETLLQNDIPASEPTSEESALVRADSEDKDNAVDSQQNKIVLKYNYKEDQWSPLNPDGRKQYDREFLLQLQTRAVSLSKLNNLPNLDIIKDKAHIQKLPGVNRTSLSDLDNPTLSCDPSSLGNAQPGNDPKMFVNDILDSITLYSGKKVKSKKKGLNKQTTCQDGEFDAFLDTKESVAESITASTCATTESPASISESKPERILKVHERILNSALLIAGKLNATNQNANSKGEPTNEEPYVSSKNITEDEENLVDCQQKNIVLKFCYKEDQWSPLNPEGKKQYDREFLLHLQFQPLSIIKPNNLPNVDVIKDKIRRKFPEVNKNSNPVFIEPPPKKQRKRNDPEVRKVRLKKCVIRLLNKLTPQKFKTLLSQFKTLVMDTEERLDLVCDLIFEKAVSEPLFSSVYAELSKELDWVTASETHAIQNNFRKLLLTKCQKEFEKDRSIELRSEENVNKTSEASNPVQREALQKKYEEQEKKNLYRRLGNIKFIGELFKLDLLTETIMHEYVKKLLYEGDEESLECLSQLLKIIGEKLDGIKKPQNFRFNEMDTYLALIKLIVDKQLTTSRIRFMLQDVLDMKMNNWIPRRYELKPKTIDQIHREAELEAQKQQLLQDWIETNEDIES